MVNHSSQSCHTRCLVSLCTSRIRSRLRIETILVSSPMPWFIWSVASSAVCHHFEGSGRPDHRHACDRSDDQAPLSVCRFPFALLLFTRSPSLCRYDFFVESSTCCIVAYSRIASVNQRYLDCTIFPALVPFLHLVRLSAGHFPSALNSSTFYKTTVVSRRNLTIVYQKAFALKCIRPEIRPESWSNHLLVIPAVAG